MVTRIDGTAPLLSEGGFVEVVGAHQVLIALLVAELNLED